MGRSHAPQPREGTVEVARSWRRGGALANDPSDLRAPVVSYCFGVNGSVLAPPARFRAMGTDVEVLAVGADADAMAELGELAAIALEALEARWSRFRPTSELCRLNDAGGAPVVVSPETFDLVARAVDAWRVHRRSLRPDRSCPRSWPRGTTALRRGRARRRRPGGRARARGRVRGRRARPVVCAVRLPPGVALDLGGIGKGYAADLVAPSCSAPGSGCARRAREPRRRPARDAGTHRAARLGHRGRRPAGHRRDRAARARRGRGGHEHADAAGVERGRPSSCTTSSTRAPARRRGRGWRRSRSSPATRGAPRCWPRLRSSPARSRAPGSSPTPVRPGSSSPTTARASSSTASPRSVRDSPSGGAAPHRTRRSHDDTTTTARDGPRSRSCSRGFYLPKFDSVEEERLHRKQRLAAGFRLFGKFGFDEGVAGHITARDPERLDHFWVNPFGMPFAHIRVSDLILVNDEGEVVEGERQREPRRVRHPLERARGPPRRRRRRPLALDVRQVVVDARSPPRPAHAGRVRVLRRPRAVRRLHRRRARPRGGQAHRARPRRQQGRHPAQPRAAHRRPLRRRSGVVVRHDGALVPGAAARRGRGHAGARSTTRWPRSPTAQVGAPVQWLRQRSSRCTRRSCAKSPTCSTDPPVARSITQRELGAPSSQRVVTPPGELAAGLVERLLPPSWSITPSRHSRSWRSNHGAVSMPFRSSAAR